MLPVVTYLTFDSLQEGVGASQVLRYVEALAQRGLELQVHTFEKEEPPAPLRERLREASIEWMPHRFGPLGSRGGARRVLRAAGYIRGARLVHARSDLAAVATVLARPRRWIWDMRSFWAEQRMTLGTLRRGSVEERVLHWTTQRASQDCDAIVALADAAHEAIGELYGEHAAQKTRTVRTCVDLDRFRLESPPSRDPLRLLLSGTVNRYYDVPLTLRLIEHLEKKRRVRLDVASPENLWGDVLSERADNVFSVHPDQMPQVVAESHAGLSICRLDAGVSLKAATPTKIGEFLATGRPVIVNAGLGDMDHFIAEHRCGVVIADPSEESLDRAASELVELLEDGDTTARCRSVAERNFDLGSAADALLAIYREVGA